MDVTLVLNGVDFSGRISKYRVTHELISPKVVTTADNVEHLTLKRFRTVIRFSLTPISVEVAENDYDTLSEGVFTATYTDPYAGGDREQTVHLVTNLDAAFGLRSVDGNRYYKGGELEIRAVAPGLGDEPNNESEEVEET